MRPSVPGVYAYELLLWARKELENLEVVTADDGGGGGGNTVHGDKALVDGKGEVATPVKRADVSGGQECGVVRVEDRRNSPSHKSQSCIAILAQQRQPTDTSYSPTDEHPTNHALSLERKPVSP
uniref:Uncharacterized protein n=1 Tax=Oryza barthii TaxID=65489 RepID=A0A0D3H1R3_9ORYZ